MKYSVFIHEMAEEELNDAIDFYDSKSAGLGIVFLREVERTAAMIAQFPESSPMILETVSKMDFYSTLSH